MFTERTGTISDDNGVTVTMTMRIVLRSLFLCVVVGGISSSVAFDGASRIICGTTEGDAIFCTTYVGMEHGQWARLPGALKQVVVRDGHLWGISATGEIYYTADINRPNWTKLTGRAKEITEGHGVICIVNDEDEIFCADRGINTQPVWRKAPAGAHLKFVSVN